MSGNAGAQNECVCSLEESACSLPESLYDFTFPLAMGEWVQCLRVLSGGLYSSRFLS